MDKYTLKFTFDELERIVIALARESDRLDEIDSPKYADVKCLEESVRNVYMDAKRAREVGKRWDIGIDKKYLVIQAVNDDKSYVWAKGMDILSLKEFLQYFVDSIKQDAIDTFYVIEFTDDKIKYVYTMQTVLAITGIKKRSMAEN